MDSSPNYQSAAVDLSGQFALNPIGTGGGGPINSMPNEIMLLILDKLRLEDYYDANELVRLRLVSKKWNSLVEDFCRQKKVLNVNYASFSNHDLKNSVPLIADLKTIDFFGKMLKLFPNIVQMAVGFWSELDDRQMHNFAVQINLLSSLKILKLERHILAAIPYLTLSKLEHLEVDSGLSFCIEGDLFQFASNLGPDCSVRVFLDQYAELNYNDILQWHNNNPHFLASLTHLQMHFKGDTEDCAKVVHSLCEHSTSLEVLSFYASGSLEMSPTVIRDLGKLTKLTKLKLWRIAINISNLEEAAVQQNGLTSLSSVLTCELYIKWGRLNYGDEFTRVLSIIFPNLVELYLDIDMEFSTSQAFLHKVKQNLNRFSNLRKHEIAFF